MRATLSEFQWHYIKLEVNCRTEDDANTFNLLRVLSSALKGCFGEVGGLDPSALTISWLKKNSQVIIKVPASEAYQLLSAIPMTPFTMADQLTLRIISHSPCLVNLACLSSRDWSSTVVN
ncbi:hypothetical protein O181_072553 [Austropuccinia psidii MF-1]|uniref:Uncharacterized protein n=1 Tax=Austropuccinia psidii MF-1 TaxID=1389203 RepID=A0A9Q3I998_9BASI|nr:hypothetical protein [Austropuccinia psidii MF-1]